MPRSTDLSHHRARRTRNTQPKVGQMENHRNTEERKVLTTQEARQGETSGRMRTVLSVSLILAVAVGIIFALAY